MAYLRVKWIKNNPYLYEQESYRVGGKVKTRHVRYIGKHGYGGSGSGVSGFIAPAGLPSERKEYVDREIKRLKLGNEFPFERDVLRQYLYRQDYNLRFNSKRITAAGYVKLHSRGRGVLPQVVELGLRSDSNAYTWLHEMGHSLEYADKLVDSDIDKLRNDFATEVFKTYMASMKSVPLLDGIESFLNEYGDLIDIRGYGVRKETLLDRIQHIKSTNFDADRFQYEERSLLLSFKLWANISYRVSPSEVFADSVASLILHPKKAFDVHGEKGRKYLTKVWVKIVKHFEEEYRLSLNKPKKSTKS